MPFTDTFIDRCLARAQHLRDQAREIRDLAETMKDPIARQTVERVADDYDTMASREETRAKAAIRPLLH
jgi:hypothetical protein